LRGRSHAVELIGYSQIQSRGMKAGAVVDLAECEQTVRQAVSLAERMAKVRVESVLLSASAGRLQGQLVEAAAEIKGGAVTPADVSRITSAGMRHATGAGRTVLHALPVSYALDGVKGIRDPKGMVARQFGVDMNVVTVGFDRRRSRYWGCGGGNGRGHHHDRDLFRRAVHACQRLCAGRPAHHHGPCARAECMHCGCRANQDVIWHRADRRVRHA
jgi:hypothetical protein